MAGDWIKMRTALADDPAVIAMADALNTDEFSVVGRLHHIWSWADAQSRDGHAPGVTCKWINRYVRCDQFAEAMINVNWLIVEQDGIRFPNFERHNGESAKARGLATNRKQKQRASVTQESQEMSRLERDEDVTREEKRREEKNNTHTASMPAQISIVLRKYTINSNPGHPMVIALANQGVALETIEAACKETREAKPGESISVNYIVKKLESWKQQAASVNVKGIAQPVKRDDWNRSDAGIQRKASELGIYARPGEGYASLRERCESEIRKREQGVTA